MTQNEHGKKMTGETTCCSTINNPDICMLQLRDQTQNRSQRPHSDMIPSINFGKHCRSGFYGSSSYKRQQKLLFLGIISVWQDPRSLEQENSTSKYSLVFPLKVSGYTLLYVLLLKLD